VNLRSLDAQKAQLRTVFWDVMKIVTADDNSASHLGGDNTPSEDATTDGNLTGERTLLVCTRHLSANSAK